RRVTPATSFERICRDLVSEKVANDLFGVRNWIQHGYALPRPLGTLGLPKRSVSSELPKRSCGPDATADAPPADNAVPTGFNVFKVSAWRAHSLQVSSA